MKHTHSVQDLLFEFDQVADIAARPPEIACFQQTRDSIERRSGHWLKELARQSLTSGFDLNAWIVAWEAPSIGRGLKHGSN